MTRLFGFTTTYMTKWTIGFGQRCLCFHIYLAKVPRRRLKGYWFILSAKEVIFHMKANSDKFRFFGYVSIDQDDLRDEP